MSFIRSPYRLAKLYLSKFRIASPNRKDDPSGNQECALTYLPGMLSSCELPIMYGRNGWLTLHRFKKPEQAQRFIAHLKSRDINCEYGKVRYRVSYFGP